MTGSEIALIITACGTLVSAIAASTAVVISALNSRKISQVHDLTNSLAQRAEASAHASGLAEGNRQGRVEQTAEREADKK